jgi:dipeptidyl aminopeptidase/acylaminoacyl peptidase
MRKTFMLIVIFSLLFVSCNPQPTNPPSQNKEFIPGKSTLPEKPEGDKNYYLVNISKDVLSTPVESEITTTTTSGIVEGNSQSIEISKARLTTDSNGVAVVADSKAGGLIPVIVLDENQKPIAGINVSYICSEDQIVLVIYDLNGKYDPQIITVNVSDLQKGISRKDSGKTVNRLASMVLSVSAQAVPTLSPLEEFVYDGVLTILPITRQVWGAVGAIKEYVTFEFSQPQIVAASLNSKYVKYECIPPSFWTAPLKLGVSAYFGFISAGEKGLEVVAANFVTTRLADVGIEAAFTQPTLFRVYDFSQAVIDSIVHDAGQVIDQIQIVPDLYLPVGSDVGKCVFMPDLEKLTVIDARKSLEDIGIKSTDYKVVCPENHVACEDGIVYSQTPKPNTEAKPLPLITITIPSCVVILADGSVDPPITLNVTEPLTPVAAEPPIQLPPALNLNGQIAFESNRSGQSEVYMLDGKTRQVTQLTITNNASGDPNWSPDGKTLAYDSTIDKTNLTRGVYVMTVFPQLNTAQLINGNRAWAPKWSPDGKHIAYSSDRNNTVLGTQIFIMNADGSNDGPLPSSSAYEHDGDLTWSPDGRQIYFSVVDSGQGKIWTAFCVTGMDVYHPICPPANFPNEIMNLAWSPDGQQAAFSLQGDIYRINADGSGLTKLTETEQEFHPTWSADGKYIAFESNRDGNDEIYVMDSEGNYETNLTNNPADDNFPDWSVVSIEEPKDCQGSLSTRLHIGDTVYVSYRPPLSNRLREQPNLSAKILDLLKPGTTLQVLDGYVCGGGYRFWKVREANGLTGWTAEGDLMNYWLVPGNPPAEATSTEAQIRYVIADIQLGGVDNYYRQFLDQPAIAEAIRRWDAGVRVVNISQFERKIVGSWMIVYAGTENQINGLDVLLTTDTPSGSSTCDLAGITNPTYSTDFSHGWLNDNNNEISGGYDYSNGGQVTFLYPGVHLSADQGQTAYISFQPYWGTLTVKLVNREAYKIALMPTWTGASWTQLIQNGYVYMVLDVDNSIENAGGIYYKKFGDHTLSLLNNRFELVEGDEYIVVFDLNNNLFKLIDKNGKLVIDYDLSGFWGPEYIGHISMGEFPWWTIGTGWTDTSYPTDLVVKEVCYGTSQ